MGPEMSGKDGNRLNDRAHLKERCSARLSRL